MKILLSQEPYPTRRAMSYPTLHIYFDCIRHRHLSIFADDEKTKLYTVRSYFGTWFSSKPHMRISCASSGREVGTVTFWFASSTKLVIHGRPVKLKRALPLRHQRHFDSASAGQLTWKNKPIIGSTLTLVDQQQQKLARFNPHMFRHLYKRGELELRSPTTMSRQLLEETIVTGLAMMEESRFMDYARHRRGRYWVMGTMR